MSQETAHEWVAELYQEELYHFSCDTLVVIPKPWESLDQEERVTLENILKAVKVGLAGAQIIHEPHLTAAKLKQLDPRHAIVLGATLDNPVADGEIIAFGNTRVVRAAALEELDEKAKKVLWSALKKMYAL